MEIQHPNAEEGKWEVPESDFYKLNFDGSLEKDGTAGKGVIARDNNGEVIASCVIKF